MDEDASVIDAVTDYIAARPEAPPRGQDWADYLDMIDPHAIANGLGL